MTYGHVEPASRASTPALQIYMLQPLNLMGFKRVRRAGEAGWPARRPGKPAACNKQSLAQKINDSIEVQ